MVPAARLVHPLVHLNHGQSLHIYHILEVEAQDPAVMVEKADHMPSAEVSLVWDCATDELIKNVYIDLNTHWPRGQSGPSGHSPVRYN